MAKVRSQERGPERSSVSARRLPPAVFSSWVVTQDQFTPEIVGGKSNNLNGLRGRLPTGFTCRPPSPCPSAFAKKRWSMTATASCAGRYEALVAAAEHNPSETLARLRALLLEATAPPELQETLLEVWQRVGSAAACRGSRLGTPSGASGPPSGTTGRTSRAAPAAFLTTACGWRCSSSRSWRPITPT